MKKLLLLIALMFSLSGFGQQKYVSGSFSYYDGGGSFNQQAMATVEVGTYIHDVATVGLAGGVTSFTGNAYLEVRPSLMVWSSNQFSVSGTIGAGYVFNSTQSFLTEYCGTMTYTTPKGLGFSIFAGGYKFNGANDFSKYTFIGTGISYTLPKKK